jgi:hypothetical protein
MLCGGRPNYHPEERLLWREALLFHRARAQRDLSGVGRGRRDARVEICGDRSPSDRIWNGCGVAQKQGLCRPGKSHRIRGVRHYPPGVLPDSRGTIWSFVTSCLIPAAVRDVQEWRPPPVVLVCMVEPVRPARSPSSSGVQALSDDRWPLLSREWSPLGSRNVHLRV